MKKPSDSYLVNVWNKEANRYTHAAENSPDYLAYYHVLHQLIGELRGKKIADIGSGTGMTSAYFAEHGAELHLVDLADKALAYARNYFNKKNLKAKYYRENAFNMSLPHSHFDVVWNGGVIEHFPDQQKILMLQKMWQLVKPGGRIIVTAPNAWDIPFMMAKQLLIWRNKWSFGDEDDLTSARLAELAKRAGITNPRIFAYNPIVGWWFFPYGRELTQLLQLNTPEHHQRRCKFGHNLVLTALKKARE